MGKQIKIVHVVGTRPNFVKIASVLRACNKTPEIQSLLVHTGQHYTEEMDKAFFDALQIPAPDINLEVGSGTHAQQTAEIMKRFEPVLLQHKPDAILVVGDVNSTVACALVAAKLGVKIIHVEAGLRSFDRTMPEEINRVLTDSISDILFITEPSGIVNLKREGVDSAKVHFVGNVMIDTLEWSRGKAAASSILEQLKLDKKQYIVITLHRPSNVDHHNSLNGILDDLAEIQKEIKIVFPVHPRTANSLSAGGFMQKLEKLPNMIITRPLGYLDFLKLMSEAKIVITDSGGIQEETTVLGVPCLTVRDNTERPITTTEGTNILVGTEQGKILNGYREITRTPKTYSRPQLWDGRASERIVNILLESLIDNKQLYKHKDVQ
jgi:UDP-N-acetylglucosamine 2-epimerase (non-hydrolysing)